MRPVEFSAAAARDLRYLRGWLEERAPGVADRAIDTIKAAAFSLSEFPERGRLVRKALRELSVPFGSTGYVLRYGVTSRRVIIARVFHSLERR